MLDDKEDRIKAEAYRRWEQEGRPDGHHDRHWQEAADAVSQGGASEPIDSEGTTQAVKTPKARASAAKPKAAKAEQDTKAVAEAPKRPRAK